MLSELVTMCKIRNAMPVDRFVNAPWLNREVEFRFLSTRFRSSWTPYSPEPVVACGEGVRVTEDSIAINSLTVTKW
jgi:hypothetical protein